MSRAISTRFGKVCWKARHLHASVVREALLSLRAELEAGGAEFDAPVGDAAEARPVPPSGGSVSGSASGSASGDGSGSSSASGADSSGGSGSSGSSASNVSLSDELPDGGSWALVGTLNWALRSDRKIQSADIRRSLGRLKRGNRVRLRLWMAAQAASLADDPYLATKSLELRLQFVALGEKWVNTLRAAPELADYLETEAQLVNLSAYM